MDTASLKISINTSEIKTANTELDKLTKTSARTEQSANGVTTSFFSLGRVLSSIAILETAQQFIKMADTMTGVESKLKLVTNNTLELVMAQQELFEISQNTRTSFSTNVDLYQKMSMSTKELNLSQKDMFGLINSINKSISISGTNAAGAETLITQLGQAFSSNFQGVAQELGTLRDQAPRLYQAILEGTGMTGAAFKKAAEDGKLSSEIIIDALRKQGIAIDKDFGKVGVTVDASMTVLANSITNMIGKVDKQLGVTGSLGKLIKDVSKHIDDNTQEWVDSVQEAMDKMYPIAEAGFTNIRDLNEVTFESINALFSVMVHAFDGAIDSMDSKYRELGFFDYMSLGFIVVIEGFRQIASGGLSALTFLGKQFNTFQSIALDAIAGVMGAMGKFQNAVGGDGSAFLEAQTFWANKANKVKQDGLLIDRTQKAILDDMGKGVDRLIGSYDKLALKKVKEKEVDTVSGDTVNGKKGSATTETEEQKKAREKAAKEAEKLREEEAEKTRKFDHDITQGVLSNISRVTLARQEAEEDIEKSKDDAMSDNAFRAAKIIEDIKTPLDKLNESVLSDYDLVSKIFNEEQMDSWFNHVNNEFENLKDNVNGMDFSSSIEFDPSAMEGTAKAVAGISKAMSQLGKAESQYQKNKVKTGATSEDLAKNEEEHKKDQIAGYSNLAGSMSAFFEEGTKGAQAFQIVQSGLAVVNAVSGIASQASLPFPYNIAAMAGTAATVFSFLNAAGIGASGGGGSASAPTENFDQNRTDIENNFTPMTDRLDRQIELLESIDKNGSASQLGVELAGTTFRRDYSLWVEDTLEKARLIADSSMTVAQTSEAVARVEQMAGVDIYKPVSAARVELNTSSLRESYNLINALVASLEMGWGTFGQADSILGSEGVPRELASIRNSINELQNITHEWAMGVIESMDDIKSASKDFKTYYDEVTGSMYYETKRLNQAYAEVNSLRGTRSFADYLKDTITNMDALQQFFTDETFALLMSDNVNDIQSQIAAIDRLSSITGETFSGGAKDALNYLESIQLVSESMTTIAENTKSLFGNIQSFIDDLNSSNTSNPSVTFSKFTTSFNKMVDAIASGSEDMIDIGGEAIDNAKYYIDLVTANATASRDIQFAKAMVANKFAGVVASPDLTLNNINNTLISNNQALIAELKYSRDEMTKIKDEMISSNNYQKNIELNTKTSRFVGA